MARMLQAFAMFNARTAKRLADGFGAFSETLLEVNFPIICARFLPAPLPASIMTLRR